MGCVVQDSAKYFRCYGQLRMTLFLPHVPLNSSDDLLEQGKLTCCKARSASTWVEHKWVTYDLIILGWRCLTPPSHVTHSMTAVCNAGRMDLSRFLNCGYRVIKSVKDFCLVL